ncbi:hypothetical protein Q5752_001790 [Cryptotrichosporon argae]
MDTTMHASSSAESVSTAPASTSASAHSSHALLPSLPRPAFPHLAPILSSLSASTSRPPPPPPLDDGLDNFPPPLPSDPAQLARVLTADPDIERQMRGAPGAGGETDVGPPPEGGKDAWLCVASAFMVLFCVFGFDERAMSSLLRSHRRVFGTLIADSGVKDGRLREPAAKLVLMSVTSMGQLETYYLTHQCAGYSKSTVAWIASVQSTLTFFASILFGRLFDAHGARALVVGGTSLSVVSLVCIAFCKEYYQLVLAHALFGISGSVLYSPGTAVAGHWFMRRRSTAVGIVVCGSGLGGVIYPIMLKQLLDKLSFRDAILIIAAMNAVCMLPAWFFMKGRLPPRAPPPLRSLAGPWKEAPYAFLVLGSAFITLNFFSPYFNAPTLAASNTSNARINAYAIAIMQAGSFAGRASAGVLADRFGIWRVSAASGFGMAIFLAAFWIGTPLGAAGTLLGLVTFGAASGGWLTLVAATVGAISPTREFGMRLGMLWTVVSLPILAGPVVCGLLVTAANNKFTYAGIFCAATMAIGETLSIAPILAARLRAWRRRGRVVDGDVEKTVE